VALFLLKDYDAALKALDKSLELKKDFHSGIYAPWLREIYAG